MAHGNRDKRSSTCFSINFLAGKICGLMKNLKVDLPGALLRADKALPQPVLPINNLTAKKRPAKAVSMRLIDSSKQLLISPGKILPTVFLAAPSVL